MRALFGLPAPAKINWFLHVTGRRPDGYHTLQTVFQFIDWADDIDLVLRHDGRIRRVGADDLPEDDLTVRAARHLRQASGTALGVDIHLRKRIPQQAGLGGGSSDAATVLIGLNRLWRLGWSRERLMELALPLGADVPVFLFGRNAWAEGIGEELRPVELPPVRWAVLHPGCGLSTAAVFRAHDLTTSRAPETISGFAEWLGLMRRALPVGDGPAAASVPSGHLAELWGRNDLQAAACGLEPRVQEALQQLRSDWLPRMSGSGTAVFVPLAGEAPVWPESWAGRVCRGLTEHPLRSWLGA